jgi:nucleoside-triphosphatase THEP1
VSQISDTVISSTAPATSSTTYYRLIAVWVLCEAMLGGIIHGFRIPVSGLIVGSCAVVCISLIGYYYPQKGNILKATIIVAIFKMMLSPQAPPPAYIAVFFQGIVGELIFRQRRYFVLRCIVFAVLALVESGLQRILVLTMVYGNDLWKVINDFINGLTGQKNTTNYSLLIGGGYVMLHIITGAVVGWWAALLPGKIVHWRSNKQYRLVSIDTTTAISQDKRQQKKRRKIGLLVIWLLLIGLYIQSYFNIGTPLLPSHISLKILLRSLIIVLGWIFIIGPLLKQVLHQWLQKKKSQSQQEVQQVLQLLPEIQSLIAQSWKQSANNKGIARLRHFSKLVLANALHNPVTVSGQRVIILTGPIQSGKTTALVNWSEKRADVTGILTPVVDGRRFFMEVKSRHLFAMEAKEGETNTLAVGRFLFSQHNFNKAIQLIRNNMHTPGWLVIDEIGPLELNGQGFSEVLKEVLAHRQHPILLVVREKDNLVEKVKSYFPIHESIVIMNINELAE